MRVTKAAFFVCLLLLSVFLYEPKTVAAPAASNTMTAGTQSLTVQRYPSFIIYGNMNGTNAMNTRTGKIDFNGPDAGKVIQGAIDAATAGDHILVRTGLYEVTQITISHSNLVLEAEPNAVFVAERNVVPDTYVLQWVNPQGSTPRSIAPILLIRNAQNVSVIGMTIQDSGVDYGFIRPGILVWNSAYVTIERCVVIGTAGYAFAVSSDGLYDLTAPDNSVLRSHDILIRDSSARATRSYLGETKGFGFEIESSSNVLVMNNTAYNCAESSFRTGYARFVRFEHNRAEDWTQGDAFDIYRSDHISIVGNNVASDTHSNGVYLYEYTRDILVSDNSFDEVGGDQIRLMGEEGCCTTYPIENVTVTDNRITGVVALYNQYLRNILVQNNTIGEAFIYWPTPSAMVSDNVQVVGNEFSNSTDRNISLGARSSATIQYNKFHNRILLTNVELVIVENNDFTSALSYAVAVDLLGSCTDVRIADNHIHDMTYQAITAEVTSGYSENVNVEIIGNEFDYTCISNANIAAIQWDSGTVTQVTIEHNTFTHTQGRSCIDISDTTGAVQYNTVDKPIFAPAAVVNGNS